jgi:polysaccharide biosynthesis transport protein
MTLPPEQPLMRRTTQVPVLADASLVAAKGRPVAPAVLSSGPDVHGMIKALRRRWLLALVLGVLGVLIAAPTVWFVMPPAPYTARTLLHINTRTPSIAFPSADYGSDFFGYRQTQMTLARSRLVLGNALNQPRVAELGMIQQLKREHTDPVEWLERELKVDYKLGSEILQISLSGDNPQELTALVDALRESYLQKIVNRERTERVGRLGQLDEIYTKYQEILRRREQELRKLATTVGTSDLPTVALKQQYAAEALGAAQRELRDLQRELRVLQIKVRDNESNAKAPPDKDNFAGAVQERLNKHPQVEPYYRALVQAKTELDNARQVATGPLLQRYRSRVDAAQARLDAVRKEHEPAVLAQVRLEAQAGNQFTVASCQEQIRLLTKLEESVREEVKRLEEQTSSLNVGSLDVEMMKRDLAHVESVTKNLGDQKATLGVELDAPSRVQVLEEAVVAQTYNEKKRWTAVILAGVGALFLTLYAVGWWEFRARRVSTVDEVVTGLGLSLVGTVPHILAQDRYGQTGTGPASVVWRSILAESVDSARTMLLHLARTENLRTVMVTSAVGGEGKTSLISHLAASFARAGRRTLLIDADLRRPSLHRLLNVPAGPGLSELLCGTASLADTLHATPADRLFVIPAGLAGEQARQWLALDRLGPILEALKEHFDFVLIDSAPVLPVTDTLLIGQAVDGVIFAVLREVSQLPKVYAAYQRLASLDVRILGAVVNGTRGEDYRAHYAGGYYAADAATPAAAADQTASNEPAASS